MPSQASDPIKASGASLHRLQPTGRDAASNTLPRNPGMPLDFGWLEEMRHVNRSAFGTARGHADQAALHQGRQPGRLAAARHLADGSHHPVERRHARARAPALRQGEEPAAARTSSRGWVWATRRSAPPPSASIIPLWRPPSRPSKAPASMSPRSRPPSRTGWRRCRRGSPRSSPRLVTAPTRSTS